MVVSFDHKQIPLGQRHPPVQWTYADEAARTAASGFTADDVGGFALQLDDNTLWWLSDDSPATWDQITFGATTGGKLKNIEETVRDTMATALVEGSGIDLTVDDPGNTITIAATASGLTTEQVQDIVAAMLAGGTHTDVTVTYDDGAGTLDLAATAGAGPTVTSVNFVIDGGGDPIAAGLKGFVRVPFAWSDIQTASLLADQAATVVVDIWKDTLANHPPANADSLTASAPLTLTAADSVAVASGSLTGWTKTGSAGDVLAFNLDSNDVATLLSVVLDLVRS